jgi:fructose-1,6-bisphosphatase/inositol monophosphatase family enzyme
VKLGSSPSTYTAVLDGLDGSSVYKRQPGKGGYGTMFALYAGEEPCYRDYLCAGIMDHGSGQLLLAGRGRGVHVSRRGGVPHLTRTSGATGLRLGAQYFVDTYFPINQSTFAEPLAPYGPVRLGSTAMHYALLLTGKADLVLECTRKGNLELAVAYGMVKEAGGGLVTTNGADIGDKMFLQFGQQAHLPTIAAATPELAQALITHLDCA